MADALKTETESPVNDEVSQGFRLSFILKLAAAAIVLAALGIGGWMYYNYSSVRESTDDAQIDGHIYPVAAMIEGTVTDVLVENNQTVRKGEVLGHIDPRFYRAALDKARGDLAQATATEQEYRAGVPIASIDTTTQLSGAEAGVAEQNAKIATAQQQVYAANVRLTTAQARAREAQATAAKAASDLARMKPLVAKEEISQQQYDATVASAATASAAEDSAASQIKEAEQEVQVAQSQLTQEQAHMAEVKAHVEAARSGPDQVAAKRALAESSVAAVHQKQAALEQAEIDLSYTTLRAPVAGLVSERAMEPGQTVARGQALMAIVPLNDVWVTANFKESQLAHMHAGQSVEIEVDAYDRTYKGHVESIAAATGARFSLLPPENATGNYVKVVQRVPVRIFFEPGQDKEHLLRPGMSVTPVVLIR